MLCTPSRHCSYIKHTWDMNSVQETVFCILCVPGSEQQEDVWFCKIPDLKTSPWLHKGGCLGRGDVPLQPGGRESQV